MQEEILIKSQLSKKWNNFFVYIIITFLIVSMSFLGSSLLIANKNYKIELEDLHNYYYNEDLEKYAYRHSYGYNFYEYFYEFDEFLEYYNEQEYDSHTASFFDFYNYHTLRTTYYYGTKALTLLILNWVFFVFFLISFIYYLCIKNCELTITEKNIIGKSISGRKVTLPLYMVSSFSTRKFLSLISVSSASGRTKFYFIANNQEIGDVLQNSINERQANTQTTQQTPTNNLDELKKLKELLDAEIITKEEFEQKKKQLLDL